MTNERGDKHRAAERGPDRRAEVRHGVLKPADLAALLVGDRRHRDAPELRRQRSDTEAGEQHRPRHDLGPGAGVERAHHHGQPGEQGEEADLDDPARGCVRKDLRDAGGGEQQGVELRTGGTSSSPTRLGPWRLAARRLRRNKTALFFDIGGKKTYVVDPTGIPIGPTWHSRYFLGADANGRDVAVRLLYGGRNSLEIGIIATIITMFFAMILGIAAGFFRGVTDGVITRILDVLWAFPAVLLGVALGVTLAVSSINFGLFTLRGGSLFVPAVVVGIVYIPYVAKPVRGQVLTLREREFVDAARQQGLSNWQIMFSEVLPNLGSTIVVFVPLILANAILLEAVLSYLGAGVQPPTPSWGTMISDGIQTIPAAFHNVLAPGIMLVLTVLSINVFGDGLRDALDPRSKVRIAH
jgi:peptide/nickel transport system permease protein